MSREKRREDIEIKWIQKSTTLLKFDIHYSEVVQRPWVVVKRRFLETVEKNKDKNAIADSLGIHDWNGFVNRQSRGPRYALEG